MNQYSLFELNQLIRATLDTHLDPSYWVVAEIGDLRVNQKGHCFLEFIQKENETIVAKIRANIWSYTYRNLIVMFESVTGSSLKQGQQVLANVSVQFHEKYGLSLNVRDIDPNFTLGEKARKRQETINRLIKEGLFDTNKSKFLPLVPQRIAVISSPTAAGYGDFINQLTHNPYGYAFNTRLFKALMQGAEAEVSILQALDSISMHSDQFDVAVIIRGGGSQVDLDCFDSYPLAAGIAGMPIPVITGIGHERDETVVDLVAHTQLKTPTAVSEFLINGVARFEASIDEYFRRLKSRYEIQIRQEELILNEYYHRIRQSASSIIQQRSHALESFYQEIKIAVNQYVNSKKIQLQRFETSVKHMDPAVILKRGYTITTYKGKPIKDYSAIGKGDEIKTYAEKNIIDSTVRNIKIRK